MRLGLQRKRGVLGRRGAQVPESRWSNHPAARGCERSGKGQTLIIATAGAVNDEQCGPLPDLGVFHLTAPRMNRAPAERDPRAGLMDVATISDPELTHARGKRAPCDGVQHSHSCSHGVLSSAASANAPCAKVRTDETGASLPASTEDQRPIELADDKIGVSEALGVVQNGDDGGDQARDADVFGSRHR